MKVLFARDVLEKAAKGDQKNRDIFVLLNHCQDGLIKGYACTYCFPIMAEELDNPELYEVMSIFSILLDLIDVRRYEIRCALKKKVFEAALNQTVAGRHRLDCIVTENKKDYTDSTIKVYDPGTLRRELEYGKTDQETGDL